MRQLSKDFKQKLWTKIIQEGSYKTFYHHGLKCQIMRHPSLGHLCGYVFHKEGFEHDAHYFDDDEIYSMNTFNYYVHGGITFDNDEKIGFDCAHLGDLSPYTAMDERFGFFFDGDKYRDMEYVKMEVKKLADQIYFHNLKLKREKKNGVKNIK